MKKIFFVFLSLIFLLGLSFNVLAQTTTVTGTTSTISTTTSTVSSTTTTLETTTTSTTSSTTSTASSTTSTASSTTSTNPIKKKVVAIAIDVPCLQGALDKRDNALIAGLDAYHNTIKSALENRRETLKSAWAITKVLDRVKAVKSAWTAFNTTKSKATKAFASIKKSAWAQYNTARKTCHVSAKDDNLGTLLNDNNL